MKELIALLKSLFKGDAEKTKILDEFKLDSDDQTKITMLQDAIKELQKSLGETKKDTPPASDPNDVKSVIAGLTETVKSLQDALANETKARSERDKSIQDDAAKAHAKKIAEKLEAAVKSEQIGPKDEDGKKKWQAMFEKDFEGAEFALSKIPGKKASTATDGTNGQNLDGTIKAPSSLGASLPTDVLTYIGKIDLPTEKAE